MILRRKILVVEDELAYARLLHGLLTLRGYEVIDAKDGWEGLKLALGKKPDLMLLDIALPGIDGLTMLNILRRFKSGRMVPVIVLTNVNNSDLVTGAMSNKVSQYIIKSDVTLHSLLERIETFVPKES